MSQGKEERKDFFATLVNQVWRVFSGPLLLLLVPLYLSPVEQGYWYTFISLAALSIFADLGFTNIVLQFTAHEFAFLQFDNKGTITGEKDRLRRLASFFRFAITWSLKVIVFVFPLIMIGGYFFLKSNGEGNSFSWEFPWWGYSLASAVVFFNGIIMSFFEGCNSVRVLQVIRFKVALSASISMALGLVFGAHLYALLLSLLGNVSIGSYLLWKYFGNSMKQLWDLSRENYYNWWPEFSSLIWRYAISWSSGYFTLQAFTPIVFYYFGPEEAGKFGISMAMWTAGFSIASSWLIAVTPKLNMFIEKSKWKELDLLFKKNLYKTMGTLLFGGLFYFFLYGIFKDSFFIFQRVLDGTAMGLLFICWLGQTFINSLSIYLRAHKKEPLMKLSVCMGGYVSISTVLCAQFLPIDLLFLGFVSCFLWAIPWAMKIYHKQNLDHSLSTLR